MNGDPGTSLTSVDVAVYTCKCPLVKLTAYKWLSLSEAKLE